LISELKVKFIFSNLSALFSFLYYIWESIYEEVNNSIAKRPKCKYIASSPKPVSVIESASEDRSDQATQGI